MVDSNDKWSLRRGLREAHGHKALPLRERSTLRTICLVSEQFSSAWTFFAPTIGRRVLDLLG